MSIKKKKKEKKGSDAIQSSIFYERTLEQDALAWREFSQ